MALNKPTHALISSKFLISYPFFGCQQAVLSQKWLKYYLLNKFLSKFIDLHRVHSFGMHVYLPSGLTFLKLKKK